MCCNKQDVILTTLFTYLGIGQDCVTVWSKPEKTTTIALEKNVITNISNIVADIRMENMNLKTARPILILIVVSFPMLVIGEIICSKLVIMGWSFINILSIRTDMQGKYIVFFTVLTSEFGWVVATLLGGVCIGALIKKSGAIWGFHLAVLVNIYHWILIRHVGTFERFHELTDEDKNLLFILPYILIFLLSCVSGSIGGHFGEKLKQFKKSKKEHQKNISQKENGITH